MPELFGDDEDPARPTTVTNGNGLPRRLLPLEHVQLAIAASRIPQEQSIPEDILENLYWLFNIPFERGENLHSNAAEEEKHREMVESSGAKW